MAPIATYVFFDLETTGLPSEEYNKTKITELSMVAVKRRHVLETPAGGAPRVQHKLTKCFNPAKRVCDGSAATTGLDNFLLEHESKFDVTSFEMINSFLNTLTKPVCLLAHNGRNFDFPILKRQLQMLSVSLSDDIMCADTFYGFYDILEVKKTKIEATEAATKETLVGEVGLSAENTLSMKLVNETTPKPVKPNKTSGAVKGNDETDLSAENTLSMKSVNETTPKQVKSNMNRPNADKVKRRFPWSLGKKPEESYTLSKVYERVLKRPAMNAHRAETDCLLALEIAVTLSEDFVSWVDDNHSPLADIPPMTVGVKIDN